jgi:hypothetical protein
VPPFVEPGPGPARARGAERRGADRELGHVLAAAPCTCGATQMRAGPQGRPKKAMYCREPALGGGYAESPMGGAGVSARDRVDRLKTSDWLDQLLPRLQANR